MSTEITVKGKAVTVPLSVYLIGAISWGTWVTLELGKIKEGMAALKATVGQAYVAGFVASATPPPPPALPTSPATKPNPTAQTP